MEDKALSFRELLGELRELTGRVVTLEIRDGDENLIVKAEGEFGDFGKGSFQLGGKQRPDYVERGDEFEYHVRFVVAAWAVFHIESADVDEVRRTSTGVGAPFMLHVRLTSGIRINLWPAMPPEEQWTDLHEENR